MFARKLYTRVFIICLFTPSVVKGGNQAQPNMNPLFPLRPLVADAPRLTVLAALAPTLIKDPGIDATRAQDMETKLAKVINQGLQLLPPPEVISWRQRTEKLLGYYFVRSDRPGVLKILRQWQKITTWLHSNGKLQKATWADNAYRDLLARQALGMDHVQLMEELTARKPLLTEEQRQGFQVLFFSQLLHAQYTYEKGRKGLIQSLKSAQGTQEVLALFYLSAKRAELKKNFPAKAIRDLVMKTLGEPDLVSAEVLDLVIGLVQKHSKKPLVKILPLHALKARQAKVYYAVREAYELSGKQDPRTLIPFYENAAKVYAAWPMRQKIERRLYRLHSQWPDSKRFREFVLSQVKNYSPDRQRQGDLSPDVRAAEFAFYAKSLLALVQKQIKGVLGKKVAFEPTLILTRKAMRLFKDPKVVLDLKERLAAMYAHKGDHDVAADLYLALARAEPEKVYYILKAFDSQRVMAKWPATPPWLEFNTGHENQRKVLVKTVKLLLNAKPGSLFFLGHLALLQASLKKEKQAFGRLLELADKASGSPHSRLALTAAYLISKKNQQHEWVAQVASKALKQGHDSPVNHKTSFKEILAVASFRRAQELFAERKWQMAADAYQKVIKLSEEFPTLKVPSFLEGIEASKKAKNADLALLLIARFTKEVPTHKKNVELLAWAADVARERKKPRLAISFIGRGLSGKPTAQEEVALLQSLARAYEAHLEYPKSKAILVKLMNHKNAKLAQKVESAFRFIDLEKKVGNLKNAGPAIAFLKTLQVKDQKLAERILLAETGYVIAHKRVDLFPQLEKRLTNAPKPSEAVNRVLGMIRFVLAEKQVLAAYKDIVGAKSKGAAPYFAAFKKAFAEIKLGFDKVCERQNPQCAVAKLKVKTYADKLSESLASVALPPQMSQKEQGAMKLYRQEIITFMKKFGKQDYARAVLLAEKGHTTADWRDEIVAYQAH